MADERPPIDDTEFEKLNISTKEYFIMRLDEIEKELDDLRHEYENDDTHDIDIKYESKHMKVNHFLNVWEYAISLDPEVLEILIKSKYFVHLGYYCNWTLMSRKFNMADKLFIKTFGHIIDMNFARVYNPTWDKYYETLNDKEKKLYDDIYEKHLEYMKSIIITK